MPTVLNTNDVHGIVYHVIVSERKYFMCRRERSGEKRCAIAFPQRLLPLGLGAFFTLRCVHLITIPILCRGRTLVIV